MRGEGRGPVLFDAYRLGVSRREGSPIRSCSSFHHLDASVLPVPTFFVELQLPAITDVDPRSRFAGAVAHILDAIVMWDGPARCSTRPSPVGPARSAPVALDLGMVDFLSFGRRSGRRRYLRPARRAAPSPAISDVRLLTSKDPLSDSRAHGRDCPVPRASFPADSRIFRTILSSISKPTSSFPCPQLRPVAVGRSWRAAAETGCSLFAPVILLLRTAAISGSPSPNPAHQVPRRSGHAPVRKFSWARRADLRTDAGPPSRFISSEAPLFLCRS